MVLQFLIERAARDTEPARRLFDFALDARERPLDVPALEFQERQCSFVVWRLRSVEAQVAARDRRIFAEQYRTLDDVAQFAQVAGPAMRCQCFERVWRELAWASAKVTAMRASMEFASRMTSSPRSRSAGTISGSALIRK